MSPAPVPRVGILTDSSSLLPDPLRDRFQRAGILIDVVPIEITIDGVTHREGIDLDADDFWSRQTVAEGPPIEITTSQPSPGVFAAAYEQLAAQGASEIVSIHVGSAHSGTLNSARLATDLSPVPVELVDTGTMSFGVSCCVWDAADALTNAATAIEAATAAMRAADRVRTSFIVKAMEIARSSGRLTDQLASVDAGTPADSPTVSVMIAGPHERFEVAGEATDIDRLCDLLCQVMESGGAPIRVGVARADPSTDPIFEGMVDRLQQRDDVVELVPYRVGASIGAHTGPGTAGGFWYPLASE